jgi:hypothetical protein
MPAPCPHETPAASPPGSRAVWVLDLPYTSPPLDINRSLKSHWGKIHAQLQQVQRDAYYLAKSRKIPALDRISVTLVYWPGNNTVHDADNMSLTIKPLIDGLRKAGVVPDDRGRHVAQVAMRVIERADDPEDRADARMALVVRAL